MTVAAPNLGFGAPERMYLFTVTCSKFGISCLPNRDFAAPKIAPNPVRAVAPLSVGRPDACVAMEAARPAWLP